MKLATHLFRGGKEQKMLIRVVDMADAHQQLALESFVAWTVLCISRLSRSCRGVRRCILGARAGT